jgi:hypothetical protein
MSDALTERVFDIVEHHTAVVRAKLSLETDLFGDLGVDGDDGRELLRWLGEQFVINLEAVEMGRHFGPEAAFNPFAMLFPSWWRWHRERVPIRIRDLVGAAEAGKWPIRYSAEQAA